ncbi:2-oxoglutarate and iron-dependent oxygenase domain-containing protein 2-like isoform X1 [Pomacea canaliculata]|uniref:2-oxoglutarate and iron-dependent oxygenase domain-containing protein 2-like isoform X1 n=1 Tax=Pomacea canaliculata TaxID=400727 RepID=UPI000D736AE1|nr:2-oxoglutarate and iron-dependent oxygenase domain-containing protein 2-like isoform X1 [Pomacea canaliculata]
MAARQTTFTCACFYVDNIFISKYKLHVSYENKTQFISNYAQILRKRGCVTEDQFEAVVTEIEAEIARRRSLGFESLRREAEIRERFTPLHKEVYYLKEDYLDPDFLHIVLQAKTATSIQSVSHLMETLGEGLFRLPVFTKQFCHLLLDELDAIEKSDCPKGRPNSMNKSGILLNEYGFDTYLLGPLRQHYLAPVTSLLFPNSGGICLDSHKAFTVTYGSGHDLDLSCHFDNSEVTLNVALGYDGFSGGHLVFGRMKDELASQDSLKTPLHVEHRTGWGVLHRGGHMHSAEKLLGGKRCNLIMWMRSSAVRNVTCPMCSQPPQLLPTPGADDGFTIQDQGTQITVPRQREVDVCHAL